MTSLNNQNINNLTEGTEGLDQIDTAVEILKNNGLEETIEEAYSKEEKEEKSRIAIINDVAKKIASLELETSGRDAVSILQKELKISEELSKNLLQDIKEKLVPLTEKIVTREAKEKITAPNESEIFPKIKPTIEISSTKPVIETKNITTEPPIMKKSPKIKKLLEKVNTNETIRTLIIKLV